VARKDGGGDSRGLPEKGRGLPKKVGGTSQKASVANRKMGVSRGFVGVIKKRRRDLGSLPLPPLRPLLGGDYAKDTPTFDKKGPSFALG